MLYPDLVKLSLETLFHRVQFISTPYRVGVKSTDDFVVKASKLHYDQPIFADVHETEPAYNGERIPTKVNKIFFDFDMKEHQSQPLVEKEVDIIIHRLLDRGFGTNDIIKVWTGKKGFHLYIKIQPIDGLYNPDVIMETKRKMIGFQQKITTGCPSADTTVFGDFAQVSRVPGIQRYDTKMFPIILPTEAKINSWVKKHRGWNSMMEKGKQLLKNWGNGAMDIDNFVTENDYKHVNLQTHVGLGKIYEYDLEALDTYDGEPLREEVTNIFTYYMGKKVCTKFLEDCPTNNTRLHGASILLESGYPPILITNMIALIRWDNFNFEKTLRFVQKLKERKEKQDTTKQE
ncbi:MAG: hypothetical protein KJI71_01310 [Patescibacteria group bacterium]|nr:hypothetical protein [Patescibacteria group bacterium]